MNPVKDFSGRWFPEKSAICFKWDAGSLGNDRFIYIIGIREENGTYRLEKSQNLVFDISDMRNVSSSTTFLKISNIKMGFYKMQYCAYSLPKPTVLDDDTIINACRENKAFLTTVVMGRANIVCLCESSVAENAKLIKIHLKSDCDVSEGVLGYRYMLGNFEFVSTFPGVVKRGKTQYPPILIPKNCDIQIAPVDRQFSGNLAITYKKSKLLF